MAEIGFAATEGLTVGLLPSDREKGFDMTVTGVCGAALWLLWAFCRVSLDFVGKFRRTMPVASSYFVESARERT